MRTYLNMLALRKKVAKFCSEDSSDPVSRGILDKNCSLMCSSNAIQMARLGLPGDSFETGYPELPNPLVLGLRREHA